MIHKKINLPMIHKKINLNDIQPIFDNVESLAVEKLGEPFTIEISFWNDGTYQVSAFQNASPIKVIFYVSSEKKYMYREDNIKTGNSIEKELSV